MSSRRRSERRRSWRRSAVVRWSSPALAALLVASASYAFNREPSQPLAPEPSALNDSDSKRLFLTAEQSTQLRTHFGGGKPVRSILKTPGRLQYGEHVWSEDGVPAGRVWVRVDRASQLISVFRGGHEIGTAVVLYGAGDNPTPSGAYPIIWKRKDHVSSIYDAPMPYTLRITGYGVAIHGSDVRAGRATHGCIGVPIEFARLLFGQARLGDVVQIV